MKLQNAVRKLCLDDRSLIQDRVVYAIYGLALAISISIWFLAVRAPLWLDETGSYWVIAKGFSQIWSRESGMLFPAYAYILCFSTKLIGTSEIALRVPSILAMFGAVYLLYLAARELFDRELSLIATIIFCLHPIVVFASIDIRPYAFGALATNATILILLRLRHNDSNWLAALFGLSAACIVWFHYLLGTILPALVLCFFVLKTCDRRTLWRQFGIALAVFTLAILPVITGLRYMYRTAGSHVTGPAENLRSVAWTYTPTRYWVILGIAALVAVVITRSYRKIPFKGWQILLCLSLAIIPILILYGVTIGTSMHIFAARYRTEAVPGVALCWAVLLGLIRFRALRLAFCVALVAVVAYLAYVSPSSRLHSYSSKYALELAQKNASIDNAPVLICSDFIEANYATMPVDSAKESNLFAPLSYYRLSVPVVPLPKALNSEAKRVGTQFLEDAAKKHERFLAVAYDESYKTLDWLTQNAAGTHSVRKLGVFEGFEVLEFVPLSAPPETPALPETR